MTCSASRVSDWGNAWVPSVTIAALEERDLDEAHGLVAELLDEMARTPGRTSVALLALSATPLTDQGVTLTADSDGALLTPWGEVTANRLTPAEASTLSAMFDDADKDDDEPIPVANSIDGDPQHANAAGALVESLTEERCTTGDPYSILPRPDRRLRRGGRDDG